MHLDHSKIILGLNIGHDPSAAIISKGKVIAAVEEEKVSRIKGYVGFPFGAINDVLNISTIDPQSVDVIAVAGVHLHRVMRFSELVGHLGRPSYMWRSWTSKLLMSLGYALKSKSLINKLYPERKFWDEIKDEINRLQFTNADLKIFDHHLAHAASAYHASPYNRAVVFTLDGQGDFCSGSVSYGDGNTLEVRSRISHLDSIGQFYAAVTEFLGFTPNRHEGKITGLAAVGSANPLVELMKPLISVTRHQDRVDLSRFLPGMASPPIETTIDALHKNKSFDDLNLKRKIVISSGDHENVPMGIAAELLQTWLSEICQGYTREDIAAAAQQATEEWITDWVEMNLPEGQHFICLAGGVFANVKLNRCIADNPRVKNVYVHPAMGDSGLAIGAAMLVRDEKTFFNKEVPSPTLRHAYLGPSFSDNAIEKLLISHHDKYVWERFSDIETRIAHCLNRGIIVGRFNGSLEWGPRALGNRSILVQPTDRNINNDLNARLLRTEFMPFAPSVLDYRAKDYFDGYSEDDVAANFMTITYKVFPEKIEEIPAVVHVDGTARPQIVNGTDNPSFYKILKEYEKLSGLGVLVNTSFNIHEQPIVRSPEDALQGLSQGAIDVLAIGDFFVELPSTDLRLL